MLLDFCAACLYDGVVPDIDPIKATVMDANQAQDPSRREALKKIALGTGAMSSLPILGQAAATPAVAHVHRQGSEQGSLKPNPNWKPLFFDTHQNETVVALAELIIPETDTPGAKAALANRYIDLVLNEEESDKQKRFIEGLAWIDGRSLRLYSKPFIQLSTEQQTALLTPLADPGNKNPEDRLGVEFFQEMKDFTIFAYYTSQVGMQNELQYDGDEYHTEFLGACTHPEHQT